MDLISSWISAWILVWISISIKMANNIAAGLANLDILAEHHGVHDAHDLAAVGPPLNPFQAALQLNLVATEFILPHR